jgi:predicted phage terminase large subunit-like protein
VVGTVLHHDSLLAGLTNPDDRRGWRSFKYKAIEQMSDRPDLWERWASIYRSREELEERTGPDAAAAFFQSNKDEMLKGTHVLWPEREDYATLMIMREREGQASFAAEKQNDPLDPERCIFSEKNIHYWDDEADDVETLLDTVGRDGRFFGACDPSLGRRPGRGDFTAIVILYQPPGSHIKYVIAADLARRSPDKTIQQIIRYARMYQMTAFAVEGNHFQELMIADLRRRAESAGVRLPIRSITSRSNKQSRIAALEPEVTQGRIRLSRRHQLLLEQLRQFPLAAHDDGPDALEMAVDCCRNSQITLGTHQVYIRRMT